METSLKFPTQISRLKTNNGEVVVVRDDLLAGGTKQRACVPFLHDLKARGHRRFVYASPFAGFAQVALSLSCREIGLECRIYAEDDKTALLPQCPHPFTSLAAKAGAEIVLTKSLDQAERLA